ncbi:MAG TPA: hypothetical protein DEB16_02865, partial [Ruminococcaceae bacterium]|nr:hypothetical protein [Oscillospiraceae bacterium]
MFPRGASGAVLPGRPPPAKKGCWMDSFVALLLNGLNSSALILIAALGMVIICGMMNVINLAHGELIM